MTATLPSKQPKLKLAGPYGHPFHPMLVTVPIGAWVLSLVLDIASRTVDDGAALGRAAWWLLGLGVISALVAAAFGLMDYFTIPKGTPAKRTATLHLILSPATTVVFAAAFLLRADNAAIETPTKWIALSVVGLGLLGASGWLGGKLAYHHGVRVAAEADQVKGYAQT